MTTRRDQFRLPVGNTIDLGMAYALGILANIPYYPDLDYDNAWAAAMGFDDSFTVVTLGEAVPNYTRVRSPDVCCFSISGTYNISQMWNNVFYCGQIKDPDFTNESVHSYFRWAAASLVSYIDADLVGHSKAATRLVFTGHSLGGAAATLLAWYYHLQGWAVRNCVVYNAPKVGDENFANLQRPFGYWHVRNYYDKVSQLPKGWSLINFANNRIGFGQQSWEALEPQFSFEVPESFDHLDESGLASSTVENVSAWLNIAGAEALTMHFDIPIPNRRLRTFGDGGLKFTAGLAMLAYLGILNYNNHKQSRLVNYLGERMQRRGGWPAAFDLIDLETHMNANPVNPFVEADPVPFGLIDPVPFLGPNPPRSSADPLPPTPAGTRVESVTGIGTVLNTGAVAPVIQPLTANLAPLPDPLQPGLFSTPPPNYEFKGTDRRMLLLLLAILNAIADRDWKTFDWTPTAELSNREPIFDFEDENVADAVAVVRSRVEECLGLIRS